MSFYEKKYQVFISSTFTDLVLAREEVTKAILNLYQIPIGMEMFSADNEEQWDVIKSTIDNSDYYVLILGHRYGSVTKDGISYTEKEFQYAKSKNIPILAFVRDRNVATTPKERDDDTTKTQKLAAFFDTVTNNAMVDFWKTENQLAQKVVTALTKIFFKTPRIGWVRADKAVSPATSEELAILSKENRDLKLQLENIKESTPKRFPQLEVLINNSKTIDLAAMEENYLNGNTLRRFENDDIPPFLNIYIDQEELKTYNNYIDKNLESVKDANFLSLIKNWSLSKYLTGKLSVQNIGTGKANEVNIYLYVPKEILLLKQKPTYIPSVFSELKRAGIYEPDVMGNCPNNPLHSALQLYKVKNNNSQISLDSVEETLSLKLIPISSEEAFFKYYNPTGKLKLDNIESVPHRRMITLDEEYYIIALKKGEYEIKVITICDEIEKEQIHMIKIIAH
jgi:hypothetical protein